MTYDPDVLTGYDYATSLSGLLDRADLLVCVLKRVIEVMDYNRCARLRIRRVSRSLLTWAEARTYRARPLASRYIRYVGW